MHARSVIPQIGISMQRFLHRQCARIDLVRIDLQSLPHASPLPPSDNSRTPRSAAHAPAYSLRKSASQPLHSSYDRRRRFLSQPRQRQLRHRHLLLLGDRSQPVQRLKQLLLAARLAVTAHRRSGLVEIAASREAGRTIGDAVILASEQALRQRRVGQNAHAVRLAEGDDLRGRQRKRDEPNPPLCDSEDCTEAD